MAAEDLAAGRLVDAGGGGFSVGVEIRLFRPKRRRSNTAEAFWEAVSRQSPPQGRRPC
jgi:LysR family transcriptional regulator, hypochlorite-specific transcription factor HypT